MNQTQTKKQKSDISFSHNPNSKCLQSLIQRFPLLKYDSALRNTIEYKHLWVSLDVWSELAELYKSLSDALKLRVLKLLA